MASMQNWTCGLQILLLQLANVKFSDMPLVTPFRVEPRETTCGFFASSAIRMRSPADFALHCPHPVKRTCDAASQVRATACWTQPRWVASVVAGFSQQAGIDGDAHSDSRTMDLWYQTACGPTEVFKTI